MLYQRGSAESYGKWADAVDDNSYSWANFDPYFKKSVAFRPPSNSRAPNATAQYNPSAFDASGGPLEVGYPKYAQPFSSWLESSLNEIGIPTVQDLNSGKLLGCQYSAAIISSSMQRETSKSSFLKMATGRPNLTIIQNALAKRILFNEERRATGVLYKGALGMTYTARATREVVVSAGAFQLPQLLLVNGVGPAAMLGRFGIPIITDRRGVGQGMQDHVFFGPSYRVGVPTLTRLTDRLYFTAKLLASYTLLRQGPLTSNAADFLAWEKLPRALLSAESAADLAQLPADWPEAEYIAAPGYVGDFSNLLRSQPLDGHQYATLLATLAAPRSRGSVSLASADTDDLPLVNPNWLTHPTDVAVAIAAYKRARAAFASRAMRGVLADPTEYYPGPSVETDEQILATIRKDVMTVVSYHPPKFAT